MGIIEGIILGAIQGITEFLPVSSSGHLVLFGELILPGSSAMDPFTEVVFHLGTLGAVLIVFAREVFSVFLSPFTVIPQIRAETGCFCPCADRKSAAKRAQGHPTLRAAAIGAYAPLRLLGLVLLATIPIAVIGLLFHHEAEAVTERPGVVALLLGVTGGILLVSEWLAGRFTHSVQYSGERTAHKTWYSGIRAAYAHGTSCSERFAKKPRDDAGSAPAKTTPSVPDALLIGIAQAAAILPGLSRSGLTISAARLVGIRREDAGVFSFLIFIPALAGALLLQIYKLMRGSAPADIAGNAPGVLFIPAYHIAGFLSSFVFGLLALTLLVRFLKSGNFHLFGWYCLAAALLWIIIL